MATTFKVEIDWTHDATWVDETSYARRVQIGAGFEANERPVAKQGTCRIVLDNSTQRFSPGYAAGALYGDLLPRREVRVTATDGVTTWTLFRGFIERIVPDAGELGGGGCVLECVDGLAILQRQRIGVVLEDSKAVDEAVSAVVSSAYSPPTTSYSDNGDSLSHYGRSWLPERTTAVAALREICDAVYGRFYIDRDGTATFITRDDRLDSSGAAALSVGVSDAYWQRMRDAQPANLLGLYRLNESSGTNAADSSTNGYDGTYTGVTLAALVGPDNENAPTFDGVNDYVDLSASGILSVLDGSEGTFMIWIKVTDAAVWSDGLFRRVCNIAAGSADNFIRLTKKSITGVFQFEYKAGGTREVVEKTGVSDTGWICVGLTWSASAGEVKAYWNGVQEGSTQTGLGTWAGAFVSAYVGRNFSAGFYWDGGEALAGLWDAALSDSKMLSLGVV